MVGHRSFLLADLLSGPNTKRNVVNVNTTPHPPPLTLLGRSSTHVLQLLLKPSLSTTVVLRLPILHLTNEHLSLRHIRSWPSASYWKAMSSNSSSTSLVTTSSGYAAQSEDDVVDTFSTSLVEEIEPLIPKAGSSARRDTGKRADGDSSKRLVVLGTRRALRKSSSDHTLRARTQQRGSTADSVRTTIHMSGGKRVHPGDLLGASAAKISLQPPWYPLRRSSSHPNPQYRSRYHDPAIASATLQQHLINQTKQNRQTSSLPWRVRRARTANSPFHWTNPAAPQPGFKWYFVRSKSEPESVPQSSSKERKRSKPLKSSMKRMSKSAAATPPSGTTTDASTPVECQQLRRVKTVDFEETIANKLISLPPLEPWSVGTSHVSLQGEDRTGVHTSKGKNRTKLQAVGSKQSCPVSVVKSKVADCAVTRTDVHVVAIAPCQASDVADEGGIDPATPTMQIVESGTGCYEVIWDDVPAEDDARYNRRSSSASQALHTIGSTAARGLERVNSKLTEWNWDREARQELFKPQIVVFPDEDSLILRTSNAVEPDHDATMKVPPNSKKTSANHSRRPSRTVSAHASGSGSHDKGNDEVAIEASDASDELSGAEAGVPMLVVPNPDVSPATLTGSGRTLRQQLTIRRLSNVDESDMKFRGHRDSVTLARSRIHNSGGISPELFMHRDSVSMAKKRMHARNHAISNARDISRPKGTDSERMSSMDDLDLPSPTSVKEHAAKALKSSSSASMLRPQSEGAKRHIRILE